MKQRVRVADDSDCSCAGDGRGILYREGRHCTVIINFYQLRGRCVCVCVRAESELLRVRGQTSRTRHVSADDVVLARAVVRGR